MPARNLLVPRVTGLPGWRRAVPENHFPLAPPGWASIYFIHRPEESEIGPILHLKSEIRSLRLD